MGEASPVRLVSPDDRVSSASSCMLLIWVAEIFTNEEGGGDVVEEDMGAITTFPVIPGCCVRSEARGVKGQVPAIILLFRKMASSMVGRSIVYEWNTAPHGFA